MKSLSFREILTHSFSHQYPETAEKMRDLSWEYHYLAWEEVPMNRKKDVYRAFSYEAIDGEDYFFDKTTRDDFGTVFSSVNLESPKRIDDEVIINFGKAIIKRFMRNSNNTLDMIFEEQKPSLQELAEIKADETDQRRIYG